MSQMDVMKDEIKEMKEIRVNILQRLIQVSGDLLEYSPFIDENIERAKDVFLCIDESDKFEYVINVVDKEGKLSYTRKNINTSGEIQLSTRDKTLNFIGNPRKGSKFIPGYVFKIHSEQDLKNLKGVLAKCFFEINNKLDYEKAVNKDDNRYLE